MTTTPTASPELPIDLIHDFRDAINIAHHRADHVGDSVRKRRWQDVSKRLEIYAAARRAQPEGEAPQAEQKMTPEKLKAFVRANFDDLEAVVGAIRGNTPLAPAATLSPLCGAQHAESGKEKHSFTAYVLDCKAAGTVPMTRSEFAAQQAAAPAVQQVQASTTRVTETKRAQLEARGYEVVGYVMQNSVNELCTLAHGRIEWLGKGTVTDYGTSAPGTPEAPKELGLDIAVVVNQRIGKDIAANKPALMLLNEDEIAALYRFRETCEDSDSGGYDVDKEMMKRLAAIGVIESKGFGRYQFTEFGDFVVERAAQLDGGQEGSAA